MENLAKKEARDTSQVHFLMYPACTFITWFCACPEACNPCAEAIMDATAWKETNGRKNACFFDKGDKGRGMSEPITSSPDRN